MEIRYTEDSARALELAEAFLVSKPVLHNLLLTILLDRIARPLPGRYWLAVEGARVVGFALQSPLHYSPNISPMNPKAIDAMTRAISEARIELPGVSGEASTAARFVGAWTEHRKSAAVPFQGQRLYEARDFQSRSDGAGSLRRAGSEDRDVLLAWVNEFYTEIGEETAYQGKFVDIGLQAGRFWFWEHGGEPVSLVATAQPVAGVVRLTLGFTPRERRNSGFGGASVSAVTRQMVAKGFRCTLYTDLGNPASNAAFRRVGYRAVAEWLRYRFTPSGRSTDRPAGDRGRRRIALAGGSVAAGAPARRPLSRSRTSGAAD